MMERYTVTVIGLGFVGLTTALGLAEAGQKVYGVEKNIDRLTQIRSGQLPFAEPGLDNALTRHLADGNFQATDDAITAARESQIIFLCVGTPCGDDGAADLTYIKNAIDDTLPAFVDGNYRLYVIKSTVPPGTTKRQIKPYINEHKTNNMQIGLVNNPEFLREGHCWQDFMQADRIVCGCEDARAETMMRKLYTPLNVPFHNVSLNTGEYIKYLSNSLLATMISYANEMALLGESIGEIEIAQAFRILHEDRRWQDGSMKNYVYPGCGYGGYCLPKDTKALQAQGKRYGAETAILDNVITVNEQMPKKIAEHIIQKAQAKEKKETETKTKTKERAKKKETIGILGLSFKPGSDDVRDTPAAKIINILQEAGYEQIYAYDPMANDVFAKAYPQLKINYCDSVQEVCNRAEVIAILTAWEEFAEMRGALQQKTLIDGRYMM